MATLPFSWYACSDAGMSSAILSCEVVATHGFSSHKLCYKKVNKQVQGKKSSIRDQRTKKAGKQGNS